jgi:hypothetical protein
MPSRLQREVVTLRIGSEDYLDFTVHKELICAHSPFFANALKGKWKEARDSLVHLRDEDDHPETIELYINWLYYHSLLLPEFAKPSKPSSEDKAESSAFLSELGTRARLLRMCYVFGNKVQDYDFKDLVIDIWADDFRGTRIPDLYMVETIWEYSTSDCPARRLVLDMAIEEWGDGVFERLDEHGIVSQYPEFAVELLGGLAKVRGGRKGEEVPYARGEMCAYHEHGKTDTPCYTKRWRISVDSTCAGPKSEQSTPKASDSSSTGNQVPDPVREQVRALRRRVLEARSTSATHSLTPRQAIRTSRE